jgi:O-antigen/teichoic acid export membrane protein
VLSKLTAYGVGPIIAIGILAPLGFGVIFGDGWERAGRLVAWMTPWFVLQFLATPVSMSLHIAGRQRAAMLIQLSALLIRVAAVWLASLLFVESVGEAYAVSGLVVYSAYLLLVTNVAGCSRQHWRGVLVTARKWILPWVVASAVIAAALSFWMHSHG